MGQKEFWSKQTFHIFRNNQRENSGRWKLKFFFISKIRQLYQTNERMRCICKWSGCSMAWHWWESKHWKLSVSSAMWIVYFEIQRYRIYVCLKTINSYRCNAKHSLCYISFDAMHSTHWLIWAQRLRFMLVGSIAD